MLGRYQKKAPNAAAVANRRPSVTFSEHLLTGEQRTVVTKEGSLCRNNSEMKSFERVSGSFTAASANILAAPTTGPSQHCQLLRSAREELSPFVEAEIWETESLLWSASSTMPRELFFEVGLGVGRAGTVRRRYAGGGSDRGRVLLQDGSDRKSDCGPSTKRSALAALRAEPPGAHSFLSHGCGEGDPARPEVSTAFAGNRALHASCTVETTRIWTTKMPEKLPLLKRMIAVLRRLKWHVSEAEVSMTLTVPLLTLVSNLHHVPRPRAIVCKSFCSQSRSSQQTTSKRWHSGTGDRFNVSFGLMDKMNSME